ncbi:MAG: hypothetical protein ABFR82_07410 [Nitrospirota bacterium]
MKEQESIPIYYVLVDVPSFANKILIYHLLNKSEAYHLRCLMALPLLPSDTTDLDIDHPKFSSALHRITTPQIILRASEEKKPDANLWSHLLKTPLLVLMIIGHLPEWAKELSDLRPIGILTPHEETANEALENGKFCVGLLKGFSDYAESYRVISELIELQIVKDRIDIAEKKILEKLKLNDIFKNRSRLSFIPSIPLPSPDQGRPAAYLINRLSNNADEPSLIDISQERRDEGGSIYLPSLLSCSFAACALFFTVEKKYELPPDLPLDPSKVKEHYNFLMSNAPEEEKFKRWFEIGSKITGDQATRSSLLIAVPAARSDLLKEVLPTTLTKEPDHGVLVHIKRRALNDIIKQKTTDTFKNQNEQSVYESSTATLVLAQRLIATQAASLGLSTISIPLQTPEIGYGLYNIVNDLNTAIDSRSRKISKMFRRLEMKLADALPEEVLAYLINGNSPVIFYSDLPFEWTLLDEWPVCLSRPVSRIPTVGTNAWQVLTQTAQIGATININSPKKVLVLDLIAEHDKIRNFSDAFKAVADDLGQKYTYKKPSDASELKEIIVDVKPEIIVLDTHGNYQAMFDELIISMKGRAVKMADFLPEVRVPPVWILSACDMAVIRSIKGSLVGPLIERGAICVIATLKKIDAFVASTFVGKLLSEMYSPSSAVNYETLSDAFFVAQLATALLYDPLLPLLRKAKPGTEMSLALAATIIEYGKRLTSEPIDIKVFRDKAAIVLYECLTKYGLAYKQAELTQAGKVTPETLLFTAFGVPSRIQLVKR